MPYSDQLFDAVARAAASAPVEGVRIIGIDGPSGSGKSTVARMLAERTGAPIVEIDDFGSWGNFAGWWPRFDEQVLQPLLRGDDAVYRQRDWNDWLGDGLGGWRTVEWAPVVIFEGVTCTRREASESLACRIWVEAPAEERLRRGLLRDGAEHRHLWETWMREEADFFLADATRDRADFTLDGTR